MDFGVFQRRFQEYVRTFSEPDGSCPFPVRMKIGHTDDVCRITRELIAADGSFTAREREVFLLAALFHDISRFEQYRRFGTFRDDLSFDHGDRSAEILGSGGFLGGIAPEDARTVTDAVRYHNKLRLPPEHATPAAKMIRDADKLAILELLIGFFNGPAEIRDSEAAKLGLPDSPGFSSAVLRSVLDGEPVRHRELTCVNDFKLVLFGWANDINFPVSAAYALKKEYYPAIRKLLPEGAEIDELLKRTLVLLAAKGKVS